MPLSEFHFRGSGTVIHPHHKTRYLYPSLLYPKEFLMLQAPKKSTMRPRPQGEGAYDTTFCTITPAPRSNPTTKEFRQKIVAEKVMDHKSANPLGRAMSRVTGFPGNTTLECGKFKLRGPRIVFVIKRTTVIALGGTEKNRYAKDEALYEIPAEKWREMRPNSTDPPNSHDSWWVRLHDLINQSYDRAYWNVQQRMYDLGIAEPIRQWYPRKDIAKQKIRILYNEATANLPDDQKECPICMDEYFKQADFPVQLPCKHFICLADLVNIYDAADEKLVEGEKDPGCPFWRCPICRHIMPIKQNRLNYVHPDELPFLRWKTMMNYMEEFMTGRDFNTYLALSVECRYIPDFPLGDENNGEQIAKTKVRFRDAVDFIDRFVDPVATLLLWGYSSDNPVNLLEAQIVRKHLKEELRRLDSTRQYFKLQDLINHLKSVASKAFKPRIVPDQENSLGNPAFPPGYERYRDYLCQWTARGCFLAPQIVKEHKEFVQRMIKERDVWWKDHPFLRG